MPSLTFLTALSATPFVWGLYGVLVSCATSISSNALANSLELSVYTCLGFVCGPKNLVKPFKVSWAFFVLDAKACNHEVYLSWMIRASLSSVLDLSSSFKTLWSAVTASAHANGTGRPSGSPWVLFGHGALWGLDLLQIEQLGHLGKWVNSLWTFWVEAFSDNFFLLFLLFTFGFSFSTLTLASRFPSAEVSSLQVLLSTTFSSVTVSASTSGSSLTEALESTSEEWVVALYIIGTSCCVWQ